MLEYEEEKAKKEKKNNNKQTQSYLDNVIK